MALDNNVKEWGEDLAERLEEMCGAVAQGIGQPGLYQIGNHLFEIYPAGTYASVTPTSH